MYVWISYKGHQHSPILDQSQASWYNPLNDKGIHENWVKAVPPVKPARIGQADMSKPTASEFTGSY